MKIFFVSTMAASAWGGSEELWAQAALQLKQQGHQIEAMVCSVQISPRPKRIQQLLDAGARVEFAHYSKNGLTKLRNAVLCRLERFSSRFAAPNKTVEWLKVGQPDLVVFSDGLNAGDLTWLNACIEKSIPYVTIAEALCETFWPDDDFARQMAKAYSKARRCFFVSQANLETTQLQYGLAGENFEVVRNPFNVDYAVQLPWPDQSKTSKIAFVGRLEPGAKGCDLLLKAFSAPVWKSREVELSFFGNGASAQGVRKMAELLKVGNCHFRGHVDGITEVWKDHHLLVMPSRYEGLPLAVVEAMLCGRPCLVTDVSGNAELIDEKVDGFIAAGASVSSLSQALEQAWDMRHEWQTMGERAAKSVRKQVPADPIKVFVDRLLVCVDNKLG